MSIILPLLFAGLLVFDFRGREARERNLYIALSAAAVLLAVFAARAAQSDHVGASLSGMISVFMR